MTNPVTTAKPDGQPEKNQRITVITRTPAGITRPLEVKSHDRVDKTITRAVEAFVAAGELAAGNYGLALVRDGVATDMADAGRLDDYDVTEGDELHLFNTDPQVDG